MKNNIELNQEWRCYHFGNFYLSSIQQGIQAAHAQMELFNKYAYQPFDASKVQVAQYLFRWSIFNKTMICLNGGANKELIEILNKIDTSDNPYPYAAFYEDFDSLCGIMTNIAIVLPARIFETAEKLRKNQYFLDGNKVMLHQDQPKELDYVLTVMLKPKLILELSDFEVELISILNSCGLAR